MRLYEITPPNGGAIFARWCESQGVSASASSQGQLLLYHSNQVPLLGLGRRGRAKIILTIGLLCIFVSVRGFA